MKIDGSPAEAWKAYRLPPDTNLQTTSLAGDGCRSYLCFSGGIGVRPVMGSRSTYTKARFGGYEGRALKSGDIVTTGDPKPLWRRSEGFVCPPELRPTNFGGEPLYSTDGPQIDAFSPEGVATFYGEEYTVTNEADRMGYRLDGPEISRRCPADIVSDGMVTGAVQIPGNGKPIVMMSDRATTGGYTKIAVVSAWSTARLAQKLPGEKVRFERVSVKMAVDLLRKFEAGLRRLEAERATYRSR
jgi:biotin-dependent carboxylase-like uncharacterized protein